MFLEKNCQALVQANPNPPVWVECLKAQASDAINLQLVTTEAGDYSLHYKNTLLHSPHGAAAEARHVVLTNCRPSLDRVHLILGLGLGYVLEATFEHSPGNIVVYEPDVALLAFILDNVDLSDYLASGRVWLVTNLSELLALLPPLVIGEDPLDVIATPGYASLLATDIPVLMDNLFKLAEERLRDYRTGQYFHNQWIQQFFQNVPFFADTLPWDEWSINYSGKPALIIGRGPSLDAAMEDIRTLASSMTLIAVGGALHRLHEAGITPDLALFYDAEGMQEQLHGLPASYLENITFLVSPFTMACCFEAPAKAKVLFFPKSGEEFAAWLTPALGSPLILEGGGTVSLIALQAAMAIQANPIVLIGQDLAFPNQQVYAGGIPLQTDEQGRMSLPKSNTLFTAPSTLTEVEGQNGERLTTQKSFAGFIRHFERIAQANAQQEKPITLINASLGGAQINGYALHPLSSLRQQLSPQLSLWKPSDTERTTSGAQSHSHSSDSLRQQLTHLRSQLTQAIALHQNVLTELSQSAQQHLLDFLNAHPLISHFLLFETLDTRRQYNPKPATPAEIEQNNRLIQQSAERSVSFLRDEILPWIATAERRLLAITQGEASAALPQTEQTASHS